MSQDGLLTADAIYAILSEENQIKKNKSNCRVMSFANTFRKITAISKSNEIFLKDWSF